MKEYYTTLKTSEQRQDNPNMFNLVPAGPEEADLFYSDTSKPYERACIGHLRGYYADGGKRLYTSWFEHQSELKTPEFQEEFDTFINGLLKQNTLNTRPNLQCFCMRYPEARIPGVCYKDTFGFRAESEKHRYYLRLSLMPGDYALYCYIYNRDILRSQEKTTPVKGKNEPER